MVDTTPVEIERPRYDRAALSPGIVHIGLGNFHRAHQAWYLHRLMQLGAAHDWAIWGAGVRAYDATMRETLLEQECMTALIELQPTGTRAEVTGAMIDYLAVEAGNGPLIAGMADPRIRIVSLTVTEGGYYIDPVTQAFDAQHADIQHDAAHPDNPTTAFGAMIAALRMRRETGAGPFTCLSCDNVQGNGEILRQTLLSLAEMIDPDLAGWIAENCTFPNSMVDCIVPATGPREIEMAARLGLNYEAPVTHENFRQWVIEDKFCAGRPELDRVGVTFTSDVHPYEAMKLRLLNAGHQVIANPGELLSLTNISDCMAHPLVTGLFNKVLGKEVAPFVDEVPGMTAAEYIAQTERRFANPAILDTTRRVAFDGSSRHTGFLLPVVRDVVAAGGALRGLALAEALWARMCAGFRDDGSLIEPNDPFWDTRNQAATASRDDPQVWLDQDGIYGDLAAPGPFAEAFHDMLSHIWEHGTSSAIERYLSE